MKLLYLGGGFVGTCSAAVMADAGHQVLVYDIDSEKIKKLSSKDKDVIESCLFEEQLGDYIVRNESRLTFSDREHELAPWLEDTDAVFLCLPTPEKDGVEGESDMRFYNQALEMLGNYLAARNNAQQTNYVVVVNKSTVPIATVGSAYAQLERFGVRNFGVVSNPEFLVEGQAIRDSVHPDRVVVGASTQQDFNVMRRLYARWYNVPGIAYVEVNPYEAAAGKLLANYFLFARLANTFDVMGRVCETFDHLSFEQVRRVLVTEPRIGTWGFYDSLHAGGSCFIKDASSLAHQLEEKQQRTTLVRDALDANRFQLRHFFDRAAAEAQFDFRGATVAFLGCAFKRETNDLRHSGALDMLAWMHEAGAQEIRVYDPAALDALRMYAQAQPDLRAANIVYCSGAREAFTGAQLTCIATDWREFQQLPDIFMQQCASPHLIMDGRRMWHQDYPRLQQAGYSIVAVGSPFLPGNKVT